MSTDITWWVLSNLFLISALTIDIRSFQKRNKPVLIRNALVSSGLWILLSALFNIILFFTKGPTKALEFSAGYLVELSLSIDNLFVFLLLFKYFKLHPKHQHHILMCGVIGALIMRLIFIIVGIAFVERFHWLFYIFGLFLVYTGLHLVTRKQVSTIDPSDTWLVRMIRCIIPITNEIHDSFFIRKSGVLTATPLFIALISIEATDIVFAADSIPAIFGITMDPFIVYTSNAFAILGLRSFYFVLERYMQFFSHLHYGISSVLVFIGLKMLLTEYVPIPNYMSLLVITTLISISIIYSGKKV